MATPPLRCAVLSHIAADWPEFQQLRAAASAFSARSRLPNATSIVVNEVRVAFAAALLSERQSGAGVHAPAEADRVAAQACRDRALRLYEHCRALVADGAGPLQESWHWTAAHSELVLTALAGAVGGGAGSAEPAPPPLQSPTSGPRPTRQTYEQCVPLFLAAVAQGMHIDEALVLFGSLSTGAYSHDDRCFYPDSPLLGPLSDRASRLASARRIVVRGAAGEQDITLFIAANQIAAVVAPKRLRIGWAEETRRNAGGLESLPDFIALPRDEQGRPIIPKSRVTALAEAQQAWACELGQLDGVSEAIVRGKLVMPKVSAPSQQTILRNHPSWESDEAAKAALGPVIAKWLASGVLEYVSWNDRLPVLLQPCGAVPKGTAPFYRLITDARFANNLYSDWGVTYTTAAQLSSTLNRCDFTFSIDISDAYHLALWAGCGGELRPIKRPVVTKGPDGRQQVSWIDALVNGCTPSTCKGGCDKDMSGIMIEGHVFRFASCQFGQKTAGSPLGALVRSVARFFARLPTPVHVAAWVDDLIFIMKTPEHGDCSGLAGGCPVCQEYHSRALDVQQMWHDKARRLNIPLSEKGHTVGQTGAYTGVGIDTYQGRFRMLPEKRESMRACCAELRDAAGTTPRLLARGRGKTIHYGCAIPFVAVAAASLSQAIHGRERGLGPCAVPSLSEEERAEFEWDRPIPVSARAQRALDFALEAIERFGDEGQPIWPAEPSSFYGAFLRQDLGTVEALVISYDASTHGWGAVARTRPDEPGRVFVGGYRQALELLGAAYLEPASLSETPAAQVYRETLAGWLAVRAVSQEFALGRFVVLVRGDCIGALSAFRKGSFRSPLMQDVALAFNELFMRSAGKPPLLLHAPGTSLVEEGVDALSREVAAGRLLSSSMSRLRQVVAQEAARMGAAISIDLFASADNAVVPRFAARNAEPLAEWVNAFTMPSWAQSACPHCGGTHEEFALVFPPASLVPRALAKARADGMRGVVVIPFTPSAAFWPGFAAASRSASPDSFDPCIVVPASPSYVSDVADLEGAQRLAVMAVDFSRGGTFRPGAPVPPCARAADLRPRRPLHHAADAEDARRIAAELFRRGLHKRPAEAHPSLPRAARARR